MKSVTSRQSSELDHWRNAALGMQPMSALGQLTQMIAHDLNNQLQSMVLHLELLKPLGDSDEKVKKHIRRIAEAVEKSEAFVTYLRDVRTKSERGSRTSVKAVIEGIVLLLEGTFRRANLIPEISYGEKLPPVGVSMLLVHEILLNVIMNAIEASENGGIINIRSSYNDNQIVVDISDSGSGMNSEDSARAAEPFFTTKGQEHQGLGLTVASVALSEFGGSLTFSQAETGGTTVTVVFPRANHP